MVPPVLSRKRCKRDQGETVSALTTAPGGQPQINHAQKVADCIQNAAGDVNRIAACNH
jgi:hypothetical protein